MERKNVVFTPDDITELLKIRNLIADATENTNKYSGITGLMNFAILTLERGVYADDIGTYHQEIAYTVLALNDLATEANDKLIEAREKYDNLCAEKRKACYGEN